MQFLHSFIGFQPILKVFLKIWVESTLMKNKTQNSFIIILFTLKNKMTTLCKYFIHYSVQYIQIESPFCKLFTPLNSLESTEVSSVDMDMVSN